MTGRPPKFRHTATGATLVEMIVVIVIFGIVMSIGVMVLGRSFESYQLTREATNVDWHGRVALERLTRELRDIRSATATDLAISGTSTNPIYFYGADGNPVCFVLTSGSLRRGTDAPGAGSCTSNVQPLADNVATNGLNFYYFKSDGTAAASATEVYYITVTLSITVGGVSETYRVSVQPRRF